jgi:sugar-specific transcriptional regulator TrmB
MTRTNLLSQEERGYLRKLGLSKDSINLYALFLKRGTLTAKQAASLSGKFASAEYRLFWQLENLGLIRREKTRPVRFSALPKSIGLQASYTKSRTNLSQLIKNMDVADSEQHRLELIIGRQALYGRYIELASQTKLQISIYAIGIAYSEKLFQAQQDALKRGVHIRQVVQQVKPSNFHVVHKWQRLGVNLRYAPSERGFHLMLFDDHTVLITFSDAMNTDDRLSILTTNPAAVRLFPESME